MIPSTVHVLTCLAWSNELKVGLWECVEDHICYNFLTALYMPFMFSDLKKKTFIDVFPLNITWRNTLSCWILMVRSQWKISETLASKPERRGLYAPPGLVCFRSIPSAKACVTYTIQSFPASQKDTALGEFFCRHTHESANMLWRFCV